MSAVEETMAVERQFYDILIILESSDFTLYGSLEQTLTVWRGSFSKNAVAFAFEPTKTGTGTIIASFFIDGRCFQQIQFNLKVGGQATKQPALSIKETRGKSLAGVMRMASSRGNASTADSAPINLVIIKEPAGYKIILGGAGVTRATLNLSEAQIADRSAKSAMRCCRSSIPKPMVSRSTRARSQRSLNIHQSTLKLLARQGAILYQRLFYGPGMGADARAMGDLLKKLSH